MSMAEKLADERGCSSYELVYERIIREHLGRSPLEEVDPYLTRPGRRRANTPERWMS
jgi:hypothetical protein